MIQDHFGFVLGSLGPGHAVKEPLHVIGGDVLHGQPLKGGEQVTSQLPLVGGGRYRLNVWPGIRFKPGQGVVAEKVLARLWGGGLGAHQLQQLVGAYSCSVLALIQCLTPFTVTVRVIFAISISP